MISSLSFSEMQLGRLGRCLGSGACVGVSGSVGIHGQGSAGSACLFVHMSHPMCDLVCCEHACTNEHFCLLG